MPFQEYLIMGLVLLVLFLPWGRLFGSGSAKKQFRGLITDLGLKLEQVRGDSATLIGRFRGAYLTILVDIKRQTFKATLVSPCGLFGNIRWQTRELETLSQVGTLRDVQIDDPELDDRFLFDFEESAEESAKRFLRQSRTKAFLLHSFGSGMQIITLTPSAITAKWKLSSVQDVSSAAVREILDGVLGLAQLSREVAANAEYDVPRDMRSVPRAVSGPDDTAPSAVGAAAMTEASAPLGAAADVMGPAAVGAREASVASVGVESVGVASVGVASVGVESVGVESVGVESVGVASAGVESAGPEAGALESPSWAVDPAEIGAERRSVEPGEGKQDLTELLKSGAIERVAATITADPGAAEEVASLLGDFSLRAAAMKALSDAGRAAVPALVDRASDLLLASSVRDVLSGGGRDVKDALVEELGRRTDERQIEFLLDMVERLQINEAVPVVRRLVQHSSFMIRSKAEQLAAKLG